MFPAEIRRKHKKKYLPPFTQNTAELFFKIKKSFSAMKSVSQNCLSCPNAYFI